MVTLFTLGIICLAAVILIPVILFLVGLPFLLLMGLLPWLLRVAGVVLLIKALLDKPTRWANFMPHGIRDRAASRGLGDVYKSQAPGGPYPSSGSARRAAPEPVTP